MHKLIYTVLGIILGAPLLAFALSTFYPYQGGTGTATAPTYGQLLVGTSAGVYTPQATSTLGLQGTFERDWKVLNTTTLVPTTTLGIIVSASSTIGNSTDGGGLTINGSATTTATSTFQGRTNFTATKSYASSISTGGMVNISNGTTNIGTALDVYSNVGARTGRLAVFYDQNASANVDTVLIQSDATGNTPLNVQTSATSKTAIKVEHNGSGTGFTNASLLSLDKKLATDIQGIFGDSTGNVSTGNWITLKNNGTQVFAIDATGNTTLAAGTSTSFYASASSTVGGIFNAVNGGFLSVNAATTTALQVANLASTTNLIVSSAGGTAGCATFSTNGTISNTGVACGTGAGGNPFTNPTATSFATTSGMVINNASSTFVGGLTITGNATTTNATTTGSLAVNASSTIAGNFNATNGGALSGTFGGLPIFSNLVNFTSGFISSASSTIGNGTATGGLTISGGSTTTKNAYFVSSVGIGTSSPRATLHIASSNAGIGAVSSSGDELALESANTTGISIIGGTASDQGIYFGDSGSQTIGRIVYANTTDSMQLWTSAAQRLTIDSTGRVGIATTTPQAPLHVAGTGNTKWQTIFEDTSAGSDMHLFGFDYVNGVLRHDVINDSLASSTIITEATSSTPFLNVSASTSPRWASNVVTLFSAGTGATTTINIGELGDTTGKTCINMNRSDGGAGSFYLNAAGTLTSESSYCK